MLSLSEGARDPAAPEWGRHGQKSPFGGSRNLAGRPRVAHMPLRGRQCHAEARNPGLHRAAERRPRRGDRPARRRRRRARAAAGGTRRGRRGPRVTAERCTSSDSATSPGGLAEQDVDPSGVLGERRRPSGVAREAERLAARLDADRVADARVPQRARSVSRAAADLERRAGLVLARARRARRDARDSRRRPPRAPRAARDHRGRDQTRGLPARAAPRTCGCRRTGSDRRSDRSAGGSARWHRAAGVERRSARERTAATVEQDARVTRFDEVRRAGLAGVRPGRAAADDGQVRAGPDNAGHHPQLTRRSGHAARAAPARSRGRARSRSRRRAPRPSPGTAGTGPLERRQLARRSARSPRAR